VRGLKRSIDIAGAAVALVIGAPFMCAIGILIWMRMGWPVLFRQRRLGYRGAPFWLLKFRTMTDERDPSGALLPDERRLTAVGRFLRSTTLDELPELVNVLRGEMSLVGPRPLVEAYRDRYTAQQWRRHEVPPGMAGPVVAYGRNSLSWEEKFRLDVWYVDNWSHWLDAKLLLLALLKVFRREGVSAAGHSTMPEFQGGSR